MRILNGLLAKVRSWFIADVTTAIEAGIGDIQQAVADATSLDDLAERLAALRDEAAEDEAGEAWELPTTTRRNLNGKPRSRRAKRTKAKASA